MIRLIPNARQVASHAASMWAIYGAFVIDAAVKIVMYLETNREVHWRDAITPIALIIIGAARLMHQESLKTATQRQLEMERLMRERLEVEATTPGPALTQVEVRAIQQDVKDIIKGTQHGR